MDCKLFRNNHLAFIDDTLDEGDLVAMQRHLAECETCARHDTAVRRSLLIFRNLPSIEPSAEFASRLNARLRDARQSAILDRHFDRAPGLGAFGAAAASVLAVGFLAVAAFDWTRPPKELAMAPVVATRPLPVAPPVASRAIVASVSTGLPLWPAAMMADEAPAHFANTQFQLASWSR